VRICENTGIFAERVVSEPAAKGFFSTLVGACSAHFPPRRCQAGGIPEAVLRNGSSELWDAMLAGISFLTSKTVSHFVTDPERMEVAFENVYILIHEKKISSKKDLLPLLEQITKSGKPLLIIAEDVGGEALATLVVNKLRGPLQVAAVTAPGFGDQCKRRRVRKILWDNGIVRIYMQVAS